MKKRTVIVLIIAIWFILVVGIFALPEFGSFPVRSPTTKAIATYYLEKGLAETGAMNIVSTIVWDYRAYDTLGEVTILFTAVLGVLAVLRRRGDI